MNNTENLLYKERLLNNYFIDNKMKGKFLIFHM